MARIARIIDDLTGVELDSDTEPTTITFDGVDYELDLGSASKDRLVKWLKGEGSLFPAKPAAAKTTKAKNKSSLETYGYDFNEVRTWAIENGKTGKGGNPITEDTKVLWQGIWDEYKTAQEG